MRLTLEVRAFCDQPASDRLRRQFDTFPVIVGRSSACQYCLEDPSRYISSNHALITLEGQQLFINDTSANGVYVNGSPDPIGRGRSHPLNHGDTLAIGDYTLSISIDSGQNMASANHHAAHTDDPFADFASSPTKAVLPDEAAGYDPFRGHEPDWTPPSTTSEDPFGSDWDANDSAAGSSVASTATSDNDWADWPEEPARAEPAPAARRSSSPASHDDELDWFSGVDEQTPAPDPVPRRAERQRAHAPDRPVARPPSAAAPAPSRARPKAAPPANANPLADPHADPLNTLLRAASLREADFQHLQEAEILEQTGKLLAQMVDAMMVLLQSRTELKNAIRSDITTLSRSDNNPLKFSFDAADALTKMLSNRDDGYLEPERAIEQAVDDLKLHQLAMLEGMKSAVRAVLMQFNPETLSRNLEKTGGISANIPITREAKLWELFCDQYEAIREEAMNDFTEVYGREFRKAYESRIRKVGRTPDF